MKYLKELSILKFEPSKSLKNVNNLPDLTIGTDSAMLLDAIRNETFTLKHLINNYPDQIKENTSLFPICSAYQLNKREVEFDQEIKQSLDKFSKERGDNSFNDLLERIKTMSPEEICKAFV